MHSNWSQCSGLDLANAAVLLVVGTIVVVGSLALWVQTQKGLPGRKWFVLACVAMMWWLLSVGFELSAATLHCKVLWAKIPWFAMVLLPTFWSFFLYEYAFSRTVPKPVIIIATLVIPTLIALSAATNDSHALFYGLGTRLIEDATPYAEYDHGPLFYIAIFYLYILVMASITISGTAVWGASSAVKSFFVKLFLTTMIPLVTNVVYVFAGFTISGMDPTPFSFATSITLVVWLIADDRWVDINRIARELLFYNSEDLTFVIDNTGKLIEANTAARLLIGQKPIKKNGLFVIDGLSDTLNELVQNQDLSKDVEVHHDERDYIVRKYGISLGNLHRQLGWVVSFVDVTSQKRAAVLAREAERIQSQFLATVSHELRTPLTVISGSLQLLTQNKENLTPEQSDRLITLTSRNTAALVKLVNNLLDTQKLESSEFQLNLGAYDLREILSEAIADLENYRSVKKVRLIHTGYAQRVEVLGDRDRLHQVISNVISNAIKFSHDQTDVHVKLTVQEGSAVITVIDTGRGIPPNSETKVFERFTQVDASDSKNAYGSGLGMHISKQIMLQHGGKISYVSEEGVGTTFFISVPLLI